MSRTKSRVLSGDEEAKVYEIMRSMNDEVRREVALGLISSGQLDRFLAMPEGPRLAKLRAAALSLLD